LLQNFTLSLNNSCRALLPKSKLRVHNNYIYRARQKTMKDLISALHAVGYISTPNLQCLQDMWPESSYMQAHDITTLCESHCNIIWLYSKIITVLKCAFFKVNKLYIIKLRFWHKITPLIFKSYRPIHRSQSAGLSCLWRDAGPCWDAIGSTHLYSSNDCEIHAPKSS